MKRALITGITGQDGSYLAELLLSKGYEVWGLVRRSASFNTQRIDHLYRDPHESNVRLRLAYGDLNDATSLANILEEVRPDEVYNLAAQSHVRVSFDIPEYTADVTALGAVRLLEALRRLRAVLPNKDLFLTPGLFGRIAVPGSPKYKAVMLPDEAILTDLDRRFVYVVGADGATTQRPVRLGSRTDGYRIIRDGLTGEETVVVGGLQRVRLGGGRVTPQMTELPPVHRAPGAAK